MSGEAGQPDLPSTVVLANLLFLTLEPPFPSCHPPGTWNIWKVVVRVHLPSATIVTIDWMDWCLEVMGAATEA
jgi:hypothetical protein